MQLNDDNFVIPSPFGKLSVVLQDEAVRLLAWVTAETALQAPRTAQARKIASELIAYFQAPTHPFQIKLALTGSTFQLRVWQTLRQIPSGSTVTYSELAKKLSSSARAIGQACRTNPIPLIIPCHRVIAKSGLGGYTGATDGPVFETKRLLLRHEGWNQDTNNRLDL